MSYREFSHKFDNALKKIGVASTGRRFRSCGVVVNAEQIHATRVAKYYKARLVFGVIIADRIFYHGICFIENFPTNLIMQSKKLYRL